MVRLSFLLPPRLLQSGATGEENCEARVSGLNLSAILLGPFSKPTALSTYSYYYLTIRSKTFKCMLNFRNVENLD